MFLVLKAEEEANEKSTKIPIKVSDESRGLGSCHKRFSVSARAAMMIRILIVVSVMATVNCLPGLHRRKNYEDSVTFSVFNAT
jgi:hypothetical protein